MSSLLFEFSDQGVRKLALPKCCRLYQIFKIKQSIGRIIYWLYVFQEGSVTVLKLENFFFEESYCFYRKKYMNHWGSLEKVSLHNSILYFVSLYLVIFSKMSIFTSPPFFSYSQKQKATVYLLEAVRLDDC